MDKFEEILNDKEKMKILSKVIAHLMGDGCVTNRYLRYNNKNEFLLNDFKKDFKELFGEIHFITGKVNSGTSFIQVQNKEILNFLRSLIPDFRSSALRFPKFFNEIDCKVAFLSAIFDDEGCAGLRIFQKTKEIKRNLEIASKSQNFLGDIKNILEEDFNIKCNKIINFKRNLNQKEFITWKLSITGKENFVNFRDRINFNAPIKRERLNLMISSYIRK
jgi:hypothetical protein